MKKVVLFLSIVLLLFNLSSCEKEDITGTRIKVTIYDSGNSSESLSGVPVKIFKYENDCSSRVNSIASKTTDSDGEVVFGDLVAGRKYYIRAISTNTFGGCRSATTVEDKEVSITAYIAKKYL